jgi:hypothetical protein
MFRIPAIIVACGLLLAPTFADAEDQPNKAAVKQATAACRILLAATLYWVINPPTSPTCGQW